MARKELAWSIYFPPTTDGKLPAEFENAAEFLARGRLAEARAALERAPLSGADPVGLAIASVIDVFASKLKTILQRSEAKDYIDIAAILASGVSLEKGLGAVRALYGEGMNTLLPLKALCYFGDGDLETLSLEVREQLLAAVAGLGEIPGMVRRSGKLIG